MRHKDWLDMKKTRFLESKKVKDVHSFEKFGIKAEKRIHSAWIEHAKMRKNPLFKEFMKMKPLGYFGKWQYIFHSKKGKVSMIKLIDYNRIGEHLYEIYCLDEQGITFAKNQLEDTRRFISKDDAIKYVIELLRTDKNEI